MQRALLAGLALAAAALASPGLAQANGVEVVALRSVYVRSGPGVHYEVVGELPAGAAAAATGRSGAAGNWLRISYGGFSGWVAHFAVAVQGDTRLLARLDDRQSLAAPLRGNDVLVHVFRTVNVRAGPSADSALIARLRPGDTLRATGRSDSANNWLQLDLDGAPGWVAYFTVTVEGSASTLPVVAPAPNPEPRRTPSPSAPVTAHAFRTVNVRSGPGVQFQTLGQLVSGDVVAVTGRSDSANHWLRVDFDGAPGWVAYFTVTVTGDTDTLPLVEAAQE